MERNKRKVLSGVVKKDKMDKTRVVEVIHVVRHSLYEKVLRSSRKFYAHDEQNQSHVGDKVKIMETRPTSKLKRWRVVEVVGKKVS